MKKNYFTLSASIFLTLLIVFLTDSCSKDSLQRKTAKEGTTFGCQAADDTFVRDIVEFGRLLKSQSSGVSREASYMSLSQALINIEALFNYEFSEPDLCAGRMVELDTTLSLAVGTNDSVLLSDLAVFYNNMHDAVNALYQSVSMTDKRLVILDVEAGALQGGSQQVVLTAVIGTVNLSQYHPASSVAGPFGSDDCWYWAYGMGTCDQGIPNIGSDAAQELTIRLNADLVPLPPEGSSFFYSPVIGKSSENPIAFHYQNPEYPDPYGNGTPTYCEFYVPNPYWETDEQLDSILLNFHYWGERELVLNRLPVLHGIPKTYQLFLVNIIAMDPRDPDRDAIGHSTSAYYGIKHVVANDSINNPGNN